MKNGALSESRQMKRKSEVVTIFSVKGLTDCVYKCIYIIYIICKEV